jgi:predicted deacylase
MRPVPEDYRPSQIPRCGSTSGFVVDTLLATYFVGGSVYLLHDPPGEVDLGDPIFQLTSASFALAAVTLASAITGIIWAYDCKRANDSHEHYLKTKIYKVEREEREQDTK